MSRWYVLFCVVFLTAIFFMPDKWFKQIKQQNREIEMDNQHKQIKGYRDLSQEEIDLMNEGKELAEKCGEFIDKLMAAESTDKRNVSLGKTNLQQGFMWAIRGIAKPETF